MNISEQKFLMDVARLASFRSKAVRLQVGGVITDCNGDIIATGYNGTVRGFDNECEDQFYPHDDAKSGLDVNSQMYPYFDDFLCKPYRLVTKSSVIHCEENLISHAARRGISVNKGKVFLTHSPCEHCTSILIQAGIAEIYYDTKYRAFDKVFGMYKDYVKFISFDGPIGDSV